MNQQNIESEDVSLLEKYQEMIDTMSGINYIINKNSKIVVYSQEKWDDFAELNEGNELLEPAIVKGKSILKNFAGQKVREYYKQIYDLIFEGKRQEITIKAKCDAPEVLRDNVVYLTPIYRNTKKKDEVIGVLHQSLIISVEQRKKPDNLLKRDNISIEGGKFIEICSLCKFVNYESSEGSNWISSEKYYRLGGTDNKKLNHSICNDCSTMLNEFL